jgi:glycosyltransferase involved in cell wall biosynthesis
VPQLLAAADVCLHALRDDPLFHNVLPTKILEYFGAHRVVVTTVPGVSRRLAEESGGSFAPTADALAAELRHWAALDPAERRRRGEQSLAYGMAHFGLDASVDLLESILLRVARRSPAG